MILFIDDEPNRLTSFIEFLEESEESYEVKLIPSLDEASNFLSKKFKDIELIILDMMMPCESFFDQDSDSLGNTGGYLLYKQIRKEYEKIPIIIFTNVSDQTTKEKISDDRLSLFIQKRYTLPYELAEQVGEVIKKFAKNDVLT